MNFLPAIPLTCIPAHDARGGVAVNHDGSLFACVNNHVVRMYSVDGAGQCAAVPVTLGTSGTAGFEHGQLHSLMAVPYYACNTPIVACFVHRNGMDTLLICDARFRVAEVTAGGVFVRGFSIDTEADSWPCSIAYCGIGDAIAVTLYRVHAVVVLQYESGAVKREVSIGSRGLGGDADGVLCHPRGASFTLDGRYLLVADTVNNRVSKFSSATGEFIAHVATRTANGISYPRSALQFEDGSIIVAYVSNGTCLMTCVTEDDGMKYILGAWSATYSKSLKALVVTTLRGDIYLLRDAWLHSSRCAWLSAVTAC